MIYYIGILNSEVDDGTRAGENLQRKEKSPLEAAQRTHQTQDEAGLFGSLSIMGAIFDADYFLLSDC
ncbi:hypothetical protein SSU98_0278 [Streptococcus suis 98HAH33]|nr:hypothetical protein SSU05_0282 [Streptococcus suis 05ZYH33]ABP91436.1 hypothetical protein SSU98_0278 [Streptococcus suis 98HAH33]